jgi:hypothetical protein
MEQGHRSFHVTNKLGLDVRLFANPNVPFERDAFEQLFDFLDVARAVSEVREAERRGHASFFGDAPAGIDRVVLTPDFHKGSLVPGGTVACARHMCIPQAIGNDICCGMGNAANFAFANRLFLGLMAVRAIEEATGRSMCTVKG